MTKNRNVLAGVRVIDLTTYAAAPGTGRIMADWGADVIKVEPLNGDVFRHFGPLVNTPAKEDENPCWDLENANKRAIALDLKSSQGQEIIHKLLMNADVFLTNTRVEALKKLKLSYEDLSLKYPRLIWAHISGFGEEGPDATRPGFDIVAYWARSGSLIDLCQPGQPPITAPYAMGDHATSFTLCAGICAALVKQRQTGQGEKVGSSLFGNAIWNAGLMVISSQECYNDKFPKSRYYPATPLSSSYCCKDGEWLLLSILEYNRYWPVFCKVIEREDLIDDKRYNTLEAARKNLKEFVELLDKIFASKDRTEWEVKLKEADIAYEKIQHFRDVSKDEQAWINNYLYEFTFMNGNKAALPRTPVQFKEMGLPPYKPAPLLGQHTQEVLLELGYSTDEISSMINNNSILCK